MSSLDVPHKGRHTRPAERSAKHYRLMLDVQNSRSSKRYRDTRRYLRERAPILATEWASNALLHCYRKVSYFIRALPLSTRIHCDHVKQISFTSVLRKILTSSDTLSAANG